MCGRLFPTILYHHVIDPQIVMKHRTVLIYVVRYQIRLLVSAVVNQCQQPFGQIVLDSSFDEISPHHLHHAFFGLLVEASVDVYFD